MSKANKIIEMWKNWIPNDNFVCPSQVVGWYWNNYLRHNKIQPLFPDGEIHDLAAVIAGSKPSAMIDFSDHLYCCRTKDCVEIEIEIIEMAIDNGIKFRVFKDGTIVFSRDEETINQIEKSFSETDNNRYRSLGICLGYSNSAIQKFINKKEEIKDKIKHNQKINLEEKEIPNINIPKELFT